MPRLIETLCVITLTLCAALIAADLSHYLLPQPQDTLPMAPPLVIVGGETGKAARPMHPDWVRSVRDQCAAAGVPFHGKSWGEWLPPDQTGAKGWTPDPGLSGLGPIRLGSRRSGRLLDGREHNGAEEVR